MSKPEIIMPSLLLVLCVPQKVVDFFKCYEEATPSAVAIDASFVSVAREDHKATDTPLPEWFEEFEAFVKRYPQYGYLDLQTP